MALYWMVFGPIESGCLRVFAWYAPLYESALNVVLWRSVFSARVFGYQLGSLADFLFWLMSVPLSDLHRRFKERSYKSFSVISATFIRYFSNPIFSGLFPCTGTDIRAGYPGFV